MFFVNINLASIFLGNHMNVFRVNLRAWIFFHLIFPYAKIFFCTMEPHLTNTRFYDHLVITTIFFRPKRKKSVSHFIILKTPIMLPPRHYDQDFMAQRSGDINGVSMYFGRPRIRFFQLSVERSKI